MRTPFIGGNWKMNLSLTEAAQFIDEIQTQLPPSDEVETVLAASPLFLHTMQEHNNSPLLVAAENCFYEDEGAYTGEVSPQALSQMGIKYVIVGHSERRKYFHETDEIVNKKVHAVFRNHMLPIICCDETMGRYETGDHISWMVNQVTAAIRGLDADDVKKAVVAYEPSWAIGTGHTAPADAAEEGCYLIRQTIADIYSDQIANQVRILYGGSVTHENIRELMKQPDIDGVLAGKASLTTQEFVELANFHQPK
ncbi:triose-phosphate isomerase [Fructilactobacillus carniphilus]|uniref:Triosephosphate isomerase n=1 Tax=Fructilactobacillus carniphilus TaxID=2940297 RepID=A0ABY5BU71_9LACO|nr:triose-phosphate isomerase [Fructilactobacillus carniphilus]USS90052.1 triose-phosphate isomerase [Fructilactobacillus carniphilus]